MGEPSLLPDPPGRILAPQPWLSPSRLSIVERGAPGRERLERFLEARFAEAFGAALSEHYPILIGLHGVDGGLRAAAGARFAEHEPLFLETYLDRPVEAALAAAYGDGIDRAEAAEIGSFASVSAPATVELFTNLVVWLAHSGRRFAVATARPELEQLLSHAGFHLRRLGAADPARVENSEAWGSYYQGRPQVFAGEIRLPPPLPLMAWRRGVRPAPGALGDLQQIAS